MKHFTHTLILFLFLSLLSLTALQAQQKFERFSRTVTNSELEKRSQDVELRVKSTRLHFKKVDERNRIIPFTKEDIVTIEKYLLSIKGAYACQSSVVDKRVVLFSDPDQDAAFETPTLVDALAKMNYVVTGTKSGYETKVFNKNFNTGDCKTEPPVYSVENVNNDCNDCGEVNISEELKEKYKSSYSAPAINFEFDE